MKKAYLLIWSSEFAEAEAIRLAVDQMPDVTNWHKPFANAMVLAGTASAREIAQRLIEKFGKGKGKMFLVTQIGSSRQGLLQPKTWYLINHPDVIPGEEKK